MFFPPGHILHDKGQESHFDLDMEHGPRASTITAQRKNGKAQRHTVDVDEWMYQRCLGDWLRWVLDGEKVERLATLKDGLAVQEAMGRVKMVRKV